eukprot:255116_1
MAKRQKKGDGALKNKKVGRKPAHQNKFKFRHNKNSSQTAVIAAITLTGLCRKCQNVIEWRKQYRKYKVLKAPKKCTHCHEKKIHRAYHILCRDCATSLGVCSKCKLKTNHLKEIEPKDVSFDELTKQFHKQRIPLRVRRTISRQVERGQLHSGDIRNLMSADGRDKLLAEAEVAGGGDGEAAQTAAVGDSEDITMED